jgi:hypothetical protein
MLRPLCLTALLLSAVPAMAQSTAAVPPTAPVAPSTPPNPMSPPEQVAPPGRDLSNTLSRQKGTITPPNVDPGMTVTPPRNGSATTPVIPPPGTPGGNRSVVPK